MTMRRYVGRATGSRRKPKTYALWHRNKGPLSWALLIATTILGAAVVVVLIFNPGDVRPDDEKGSRQSSGVTPESTTPPASEIRGTVLF